jgi:hypothetical protein
VRPVHIVEEIVANYAHTPQAALRRVEALPLEFLGRRVHRQTMCSDEFEEAVDHGHGLWIDLEAYALALVVLDPPEALCTAATSSAGHKPTSGRARRARSPRASGASARVSCTLYPGRRLGNPRSTPYTLRDNLLSTRLRGRTRGRMEHGATADGPPALNRQTLQKARERAYLERFRESFADFPDGEVVSFERPDFLVKAQPRWIGIELTEYHVQEPDKGWGSPMRALERTGDKALRTASAQYQSKGLPAVEVHVHWNSHQVFSSRRVQGLAADLADLVQEHLPEPGHKTAIRHRHHPAWRSLPQEMISLSIDRRINFSKNSWTSVRGASVPTLTPPELQQIMRGKEAKVPRYRRQCREVWLLIVARGFEPSTHVDIGSEVESYRYESGFDRVFFLHHANEYVAELRLRPAS